MLRHIQSLTLALLVSNAVPLPSVASAGELPHSEAVAHHGGTLGVLLRFPRYEGDANEPESERVERLRELASAIDAATPWSAERALLVTVAKHESQLARHVQLDEAACRDGESHQCDSGAAWSPFQLHGTDRQGGGRRAARIALSRLRGAAERCGGDTLETRYHGALALYATGSKCTWSGTAERIATWKRVLARIGVKP